MADQGFNYGCVTFCIVEGSIFYYFQKLTVEVEAICLEHIVTIFIIFIIKM